MRRLAICSLLLMAACEPDVSGVWTEQAGLGTYEFMGDGQARITVLGTSVAARYLVDDDRVVVSSPQGTVVLTVRDDQLIGPMGLVLSRRNQ